MRQTNSREREGRWPAMGVAIAIYNSRWYNTFPLLGTKNSAKNSGIPYLEGFPVPLFSAVFGGGVGVSLTYAVSILLTWVRIPPF